MDRVTKDDLGVLLENGQCIVCDTSSRAAADRKTRVLTHPKGKERDTDFKDSFFRHQESRALVCTEPSIGVQLNKRGDGI